MGLDAPEMEDEKIMTNKIQNSNITYLVIIITLVAMAGAGCSRRDSTAQAAETAVPVVNSPKAVADDSQSDQVKHKVMAFDLEGMADDGTKKWDVKGQSAEAVTEDQVKLNNITASSYGKDAQTTITADAGLYDKTKNNVHLEQNVKAVIEDMGKSAVTPAQKPKKTKTVITCDAEVEFNYEKNEGYFNKNVHVVNDEGMIDADRITIYLDHTTKTIKTIVADGNVRIQRGENTTFSDKATYIEADKKIVLSGQPRLVIYQEGDLQANMLGAPVKNPDFDKAKSG